MRPVGRLIFTNYFSNCDFSSNTFPDISSNTFSNFSCLCASSHIIQCALW